jgi:hypothetical protein
LKQVCKWYARVCQSTSGLKRISFRLWRCIFFCDAVRPSGRLAVNGVTGVRDITLLHEFTTVSLEENGLS